MGVVTRKLQLLQRAFRERGYDASIHTCDNYFTDTDRQAETLANVCRQKPAAIACYTLGMSDAALHELQKFCDGGGAVVCFDTPFELKGDNGDYVVFDRADNTFQATRHLVGSGHRRIGFFSNSGGHDPNRLRGFKCALRESGLSWSDEMSFFGAQFQQAGEMPLGEQIGQRMGAYFRRMPARERPTAMCITDDYVAAAFIAEIMRGGIRVPQDLSVVGHDDMPVAAFSCAVPLTTVSQPVAAIAHETVDLLTSRLCGEYSGASRRVVVQGELVVRQSTAPLG